MKKIKELIDKLRKSNTYYKFKGDDKLYSMNFFTYFFKKHKVFEKTSVGCYKIKDNISDVFFNYCDMDCFIDGSLGSSVSVRETCDNLSRVRILSDNITLIFDNDVDNRETMMRFVNSNELCELSYKNSCLYVEDAENTEISGNLCMFESAYIFSKNTKIINSDVDIKMLEVRGDKLELDNFKGNILHSYLNVSKKLEVSNCCLESKDGNFESENVPKIESSIWSFDKPLVYNEGSIGGKSAGIILDDSTFSKDSCIDLERAYVSYALKEVLAKVESTNNSKAGIFNKMIDKDIEDLEKYMDELETRKVEFKSGLNKTLVKQYTNKNH